MGFRQQERLLSLRILRFMSDAENDCGERERKFTHILFLSLLLSNFNKAMNKLLLIATACEHLLNSRS